MWKQAEHGKERGIQKTENEKEGGVERQGTRPGKLFPHRVRRDCICHLFSFPCRMFTMEMVHSKPFMLTPTSCIFHSIAMMKGTFSLAVEPQMRFGLFL